MLNEVNVMHHQQQLTTQDEKDKVVASKKKKRQSLYQQALIQIRAIAENDRSLFIFSEQNTIRAFARLISDSIYPFF